MATVATDTRRDGGDVADDRAPRVSAARARAARRRARLQANAKNRLKFVRGDSAKLDVAPAPPTPQLQRFQSAPVKASAAPARAPPVAPRRASDDVGSSAEPAADRPGQHAQGAGGGS